MSQVNQAGTVLARSPSGASGCLPSPPPAFRAAFGPQPAMILQRARKASTPRSLQRFAVAAIQNAAEASYRTEFPSTGPAASQAADSYSTSSEACAALWKGSAHPLLTLERSLPAAAKADAVLWGSGCFSAEVYPDLPAAASWRGLLQHGIGRLTGGRQPDETAGPVESSAEAGAAMAEATSPVNGPGVLAQHAWLVRTVAAQVRSRGMIRERMSFLAGDRVPPGSRPADALLCVSGSHPARQLPGISRLLPNSFDVLRMAADMKRSGELPSCLSLVAAENPLLDPASRLERKMEAGADVVLTQPPLVWEPFEAWLLDAHRRGLSQQVRVVVGMPMLASSASLAFWIGLCSAWNVPGVASQLDRFRREEAAGRPAFQAFLRTYNADLIAKVLSMPGVAGMHVMPIGKGARSLTTELLLNRENDSSKLR